MQFVLDASITLDWFYEDEQRSLARPLALILSGDARGLVPSIWWHEVRNGMLLGVRRKRVTDERVRDFSIHLSDAPIEIGPLPDAAAVFDLASKHGLTFYDASYLELAVRKRCPLATLDGALIKAAAAEGVRMMALP